MASFWMCDLPATEAASSDAFQRNQLACHRALTHDGASRVGRVTGERRALRVLVVDDEQDATVGLVKLVTGWGHAARWAYDGATGLKVAAAQHPDVVLLDLEMPFMDGCEVARQLRLDFPRIECFVIGLAAWANEQCRQQCSAADIDLVLVKPVDPSVLETLLMLECEHLNRARTDRGPEQVAAAARGRARQSAGTARGGPPC